MVNPSAENLLIQFDIQNFHTISIYHIVTNRVQSILFCYEIVAEHDLSYTIKKLHVLTLCPDAPWVYCLSKYM